MKVPSRPIGLWIAAQVAEPFGLLTILSGGRALSGGTVAQAAAGNALPFVPWFNFLSGFVYGLARLGIALRKGLAGKLGIRLAFAILAVFAVFGWHVLQGGADEMRNVGAMVLRLAVWVGIAGYLDRSARAG